MHLASKSVVVLLSVAVAGCFAPKTMGDPAPLGTSSSGGEGEASAGESGQASGSGVGETGEDESGDDPATSSGSEGGETTGDAESTGGAICGDGVLDDGEECDDGNAEDLDACSNACVKGFHTGSLELCSEDGQTMCGYFEADCRRAPNGGELASVCLWPLATAQDACDGTPGIWTLPDSQFAEDTGFDFPLAGACITQLRNLDCSMADAQLCTEVGAALCFRERGPAGEDLDAPSLCWWDLDEPGCAESPGIWTTADSGFGQDHPNALPPSDAPACILQVSAL